MPQKFTQINQYLNFQQNLAALTYDFDLADVDDIITDHLLFQMKDGFQG